MDQISPDLVVGIDFGMTQTGVAYCQAPWTNVKTFQTWTLLEHEVFNKVPSRLSYSRVNGRVTAWGLNCDVAHPNNYLIEHFKLYLDPEYHDDYEDISHEDAKMYYRDYMAQIHSHVVEFLSRRIPYLDAKAVDWVFSVPTTWQNPGLINTLEILLRQAGFGTDGNRHRVRMSLTEAEAAAICVASQQIERGDVIVVCDAGGGTTDLSVLKVESSRGQPIQLMPLLPVKGKPFGSAMIDIRVQQHLAQRLNFIAHRLPATPGEIAERMMTGKFERFKCAYGSPGTDVPLLPLDVPGLPPGTDIPLAEITNSRMTIPHALLQQFFDEQVDGMLELINDQLLAAQRKAPLERISYLILSGGLGMSVYVRERLRAHFTTGTGSRYTNALGMQLLLAENAQLAPVLGLVMERAQELGSRVAPITQRCARLSYGMVVDQLYEPNNANHIGQKIIKDPRDNKRYAKDQVEWLIYEGEKLPSTGVSRHVRTRLHQSHLAQKRPWRAQFVSCSAPRDACPTSLHDPSVKTLCTVEANLYSIKTKIKNDHWWDMAPRYELAEFDVRMIPGSADLTFQLWNQDKMISDEHASITVEWGVVRSIQTQIDSPGQRVKRDF